MKVTLISTLTYPSDQGIRTISSVVKDKGNEVKLIFMALSEDYTKNYSLEDLKQLRRHCEGSELIGINSFASTADRANRILAYLKPMGIPIVYGGVHATICPEDCIQHCDIVCVGEAEDAMLDVIDAIKNKKDMTGIANLWVRKGGEIFRNPVRNLIDDLDTLPYIDYTLDNHFILDSGYIRRFQESDLDGQIFFLTGRGCPYSCEYCSNSLLNELYRGKAKKILRWHSPEYIIDNIVQLKNKFPTLRYFDIRDDTFSFRSLDQIKEFSKLYKEKVGLRYKILGDPKTVTTEKIKALVDSGCTDIIIGVQGSERANREIYRRYQSNDSILKAAKILHQFKDRLAVMYDVITCNPYEEPEDVIDLIRLLQKLPKPYFLSVNNLVFFPGTKIDDKARVDGTVLTEEEAAYQLNYWNRKGHLLLKRKNMYLVLILNLMRGVVTDKRFGMMSNKMLNYLMEEHRIQTNLSDPKKTIMALQVVGMYDLVRERILKPTYRSMPVGFKTWYDSMRYRV
jgi:anaerobic magnesium-protoporphyrin IX monomethyl ester cyclase